MHEGRGIASIRISPARGIDTRHSNWHNWYGSTSFWMSKVRGWRWSFGNNIPTSSGGGALGGMPREQKMLKGYLPTQSHTSPSILAYEDQAFGSGGNESGLLRAVHSSRHEWPGGVRRLGFSGNALCTKPGLTARAVTLEPFSFVRCQAARIVTPNVHEFAPNS